MQPWVESIGIGGIAGDRLSFVHEEEAILDVQATILIWKTR